MLTLIDFTSENVLPSINSFSVLVKELKKTDHIWKDVQLKISCRFITEVLRTSNVFAVDPLSLKRKCVMFEVLSKLFVIPLPNKIERY